MGCRHMAPIVHGLEQQYRGRIDFLYLDIADERNTQAKQRLGFRATPHFFLLTADGRPLETWQGIVAGSVLDAALQRAQAEGPVPR